MYSSGSFFVPLLKKSFISCLVLFHLISSCLVFVFVFAYVFVLAYRRVCVSCRVCFLSYHALFCLMHLILLLAALVLWFIQAAITSSLAPSTWTTSTSISQNSTTSQTQEPSSNTPSFDSSSKTSDKVKDAARELYKILTVVRIIAPSWLPS